MRAFNQDQYEEAAEAIKKAAEEARRQAQAGQQSEGAHEQAQGTDEEDDAFEVLASRTPSIDEAAFYGPLRQIVEAATKDSEATRVGVAMHLIACVTTYLRPFCIAIGDETVPLNLFALQVGPSAKGRKGTSAATTNGHILPAMRAHAEAMRDKIAADEQSVSEAQSRRRDCEARVRELATKRQLMQGWTRDEIDRLRQIAKQHEAEKAPIEQRIATWTEKVQATDLAPSTLKDYQRALGQETAKLEALRQRIADLDDQIERVTYTLEHHAESLGKVDAEITAAKAELDAISVTGEHVPTWMRMLAEHATPPVTLFGLSSGEGLIHAIRDPGEAPTGDGAEPDPGAETNRALVDLSEFGSVLQVTRRIGNTLSDKLRDAYDCRPMMNSAKTSPTKCARPFVSLSAAITPSELAGLMFDGGDKSVPTENGLASRFIYALVKRPKLVPIPKPSAGLDQFAKTLFDNIASVYRALEVSGPHLCTPIEFDESGEAEWIRRYEAMDGQTVSSERAEKLMTRATAHGRRLAAILAILNGEHKVSAAAVKAAAAWVEYSAATADAVASTMGSRVQHAKLRADAEKVLAVLKKGEVGELHKSRDVRRAAGNMPKKDFVAAVRHLLSLAPSPIVAVEVDWTSGNGTRRKRAEIGLADGGGRA